MSSYFIDTNNKRPSYPDEARNIHGNYPSTENGHLHRHDIWSGDIPAGFTPETPEEKGYNRVVNRKLDIFLLPLLSILYLFSGLDRSNVGNAETEGMYPSTHPYTRSHTLVAGPKKLLPTDL